MAAAVMSGTVNYFAGRDESLHNFAEMDANTASEKEHFDLHYIQSVVSDGSTSDTRIVEVVELNNCNSSGDGVREQMGMLSMFYSIKALCWKQLLVTVKLQAKHIKQERIIVLYNNYIV